MNKQQLQQEIADLQKQLEEKQKALSAMPEKWEPKGGEYWVNAHGLVRHDVTSRVTRDYGAEYATREQAEKAAKAMRAHNRLLAYVAEFAPDYEPDWNDGAICIEYAHDEKEYGVDKNFLERIGAVYMPEHIARELAAKLNSGEVEL